MTSGGVRATSGPSPDPNSLKSGNRSWITLDAAGYQGEIPEWPLSGLSDRESAVWESHWRKPQAIRWAAEQLEWNVAVYVRRFCEAEVPDSSTALSTLVKQLAEDLGLTKAGMARNLWRISSPPTLAAVPSPDAAVIPIRSGSSRDRFKKG